MVFTATRLEETTKRVSVDRKEKRGLSMGSTHTVSEESEEELAVLTAE